MLHKSGRGDTTDEKDDEVDRERGKNYMVDVLYDVNKLISIFFCRYHVVFSKGL